MKKIREFIKNKISEEFGDLETHDKIYKTGATAFFLYLAIGMVSLLFFKQAGKNIIAGFFSYIIGLIFTIAVAVEYWKQIQSLYKTLWFKWLMGGVAVLVYKYSELHADDFINEFTSNEPSYFQTGTSVLATLFLPYSWLLAISTFLTIFILFNWVFIPLEKKGEKKQLEGWKYLARALGLLVILVLAQKATNMFEKKDSIPTLIAKEVLLRTEYFEYSQCQNVNKGELSAYLDRGYISIFNPKSQKFRTEMCNLGITSGSR
jgi:hypothetical protein